MLRRCRRRSCSLFCISPDTIEYVLADLNGLKVPNIHLILDPLITLLTSVQTVYFVSVAERPGFVERVHNLNVLLRKVNYNFRP
jgi:hypothetical protein